MTASKSNESAPKDSPGQSSGAVAVGGSTTNLLKKFDDEIDAANLTTTQILARLNLASVGNDDDPWPSVLLTGIAASHSFLPGYSLGLKLQIDGSLGHHGFAHLRRGDIRVNGNVGAAIGDAAVGGVIRISGNAGRAAGVCQSGGTIAVYGHAGNRAAASIRGGGIFIKGNAGDEVGIGGIGGTVVIGGETGGDLGLGSRGVTYFVRGKPASLAAGIVKAKLRKQAELRLGMLLMNALIRGSAAEFSRYVHEQDLASEESTRGAVNPSWR